MRRSLKIASVTVVLLLLLGVVIVYGKPQNTGDKSKGFPPDNRPPDNRPPINRPPVKCPPIPCLPERQPKLELLRRLIETATPTEINGTVVALVEKMLVLDTDEGHVRIHLPPTWSVNYTVLEKEELFNNTFSAIGENVTVKALKAVLFDGDGFRINVMMGYEIVNANSVHAYAVLPFNIEVEG